MSTDGTPLSEAPRTYAVPDEVADVVADALSTPGMPAHGEAASRFELESARKLAVVGEITAEEAQQINTVLLASAAGSTAHGLLGGEPATVWLGFLLEEIAEGGDGTQAITAAGLKRVATPSGARRFRQPIGTPIVRKPRPRLARIRISATSRPGSGKSSSSGKARSGNGGAPATGGPRSGNGGAPSTGPKPKSTPGPKNAKDAQNKPSKKADRDDKDDSTDKPEKRYRPYDAGIFWDGHTRKAKEHKDKASNRPSPRDVVDGGIVDGMGGLGGPGLPNRDKDSDAAARRRRGRGAGDSGGSGSGSADTGGKRVAKGKKVSSGSSARDRANEGIPRTKKAKSTDSMNQAPITKGGKLIKLHGDETRSYTLKDALSRPAENSADASPGLKKDRTIESLKKRLEQRRLEAARRAVDRRKSEDKG